MSYCRWSDDHGRCDLYAYADIAGGYTVHVARQRPNYAGAFPGPPSMVLDPDAWYRWWMAADKLAKSKGHSPIGGPDDGQTFRVDTLEELRDVLLYLRNAGYLFPDSVIEEVEAEIRGEA